MKTRKSTTTFKGRDIQVEHTEPTMQDWLDYMGAERCAKIVTDYVNRHHFLPAIRKAGEVLDGKVEFKTDAGKAKAESEAQGIADKLTEVFDIREFLPDAKGTTVRDDKTAKQLRAEWGKATEVKKLAALAMLGLDAELVDADGEVVADAYNAARAGKMLDL